MFCADNGYCGSTAAYYEGFEVDCGRNGNWAGGDKWDFYPDAYCDASDTMSCDDFALVIYQYCRGIAGLSDSSCSSQKAQAKTACLNGDAGARSIASDVLEDWQEGTAPSSQLELGSTTLSVMGGIVALLLSCIGMLLCFAICIRPLLKEQPYMGWYKGNTYTNANDVVLQL